MALRIQIQFIFLPSQFSLTFSLHVTRLAADVISSNYGIYFANKSKIIVRFLLTPNIFH